MIRNTNYYDSDYQSPSISFFHPFQNSYSYDGNILIDICKNRQTTCVINIPFFTKDAAFLFSELFFSQIAIILSKSGNPHIYTLYNDTLLVCEDKYTKQSAWRYTPKFHSNGMYDQMIFIDEEFVNDTVAEEIEKTFYTMVKSVRHFMFK